LLLLVRVEAGVAVLVSCARPQHVGFLVLLHVYRTATYNGWVQCTAQLLPAAFCGVRGWIYKPGIELLLASVWRHADMRGVDCKHRAALLPPAHGFVTVQDRRSTISGVSRP
jgi:hypothetical protein